MEALGVKFEALAAKLEDLGTKFEAPGAKLEALGANFKVPGANLEAAGAKLKATWGLQEPNRTPWEPSRKFWEIILRLSLFQKKFGFPFSNHMNGRKAIQFSF